MKYNCKTCYTVVYFIVWITFNFFIAGGLDFWFNETTKNSSINATIHYEQILKLYQSMGDIDTALKLDSEFYQTKYNGIWVEVNDANLGDVNTSKCILESSDITINDIPAKLHVCVNTETVLFKLMNYLTASMLLSGLFLNQLSKHTCRKKCKRIIR